MDVNYVAPLQDEAECRYLRQNFVFCLREKALKDVVPTRRQCNVEQILWLSLECPNLYEKDFWNPEGLRKSFIDEKLLQQNPKRTYYKRIEK